MKIHQLYTNCLAEAAYFIESEGEAVVIDPIRESTPYIKLAKERNVKIKYIFETHFHADFVSGHLDLAHSTGADIVFGPTASPKFPIIQAKDGQRFKVGAIEIEAIHTPGHTPESTCYLLYDESGKRHAIFTGDTLFVGDVGRPDLLDGVIISKEEQVGHLYDSLQNKIKTLEDDIIVYPGHGPGSMCGKSIGTDTTSTIGKEKATNYALQDMSLEVFQKTILDGQLPAPQYFVKNAIINRTGYTSIDEVMKRNDTALSLAEFVSKKEEGALVLDVRNADDFAASHIPSSINVGLDGSFAVWVGTLISDIAQNIVIIAPEGRGSETVLRLARVGYENISGYLQGGYESWEKAGMPKVSFDRLNADAFMKKVEDGHHKILDVRNVHEYETAHIKGALWIPLRDLPQRMNELSKAQPMVVHCAGGYRSSIAISLLQKEGFVHLHDTLGGFSALKDCPLPIESAQEV